MACGFDAARLVADADVRPFKVSIGIVHMVEINELGCEQV